jgi:hypothetical protein
MTTGRERPVRHEKPVFGGPMVGEIAGQIRLKRAV